MEETKKISELEIPIDLQKAEANQNGVHSSVVEKEEYTLGITEERTAIRIEKFKHVVFLQTNQANAIVNKLHNCYEVKHGTWHYIPRNINTDLQKEHNNCKFMIEFYCVDDKKELKRFTKTIEKYFPSRNIEWNVIDNEFITLYNQTNGIIN